MIKLKSELKMTSRFLAVGVGEMLLPRISMRNKEFKAFAVTPFLPMTRNLVLSGFSFNLLLYIKVWTDTREFWKLWMDEN